MGRRSRIRRSLSFLALVALLGLPAAAFAAPPVVDWPGTSWFGMAKLKAKLGGVGTLGGPVTVNLDFGPQTAPLLAADEFLISLDDGDAVLPIPGTWSLDDKGRPLLLLDTAGLEADVRHLLLDMCLEQIASEECGDLFGVPVFTDPSDFRAKLEPKDEDGVIVVVAQVKLRVELLLTLGERLKQVTFSFRAKDLVQD